jgi:hypothetical protein
MAQVDVVGLVDGLAGRAHWPYDVLAELMNQAPEVLPDVLHAGIERLAHSSPAIDALVGQVDAGVLAREAEHSVVVLAAGADPNDSQAASAIAYVSLQDPSLLRKPMTSAIWAARRRLTLLGAPAIPLPAATSSGLRRPRR